jgi:ferrous iron transport protein A
MLKRANGPFRHASERNASARPEDDKRIIRGATKMKLNELQVGDRARVAGYAESGGTYRRKLLSMGLTPGAEISVVRVAPMGDPVEIRVRGFALSVRKDEAAAVSVEKLA